MTEQVEQRKSAKDEAIDWAFESLKIASIEGRGRVIGKYLVVAMMIQDIDAVELRVYSIRDLVKAHRKMRLCSQVNRKYHMGPAEWFLELVDPVEAELP